MNEWRTRAACLGLPPETFYNQSEDSADYRKARRICASCPVQAECLEAAMVEEGTLGRGNRFGLRAGVTPSARYAEYRRRVKEAAA